MAKPIRGDKGRFAGSIGDGKSNIPTPTSLPSSHLSVPEGDNIVTMAQIHHEHIRQLAVATDTEIADLYRNLFEYESKIMVSIESLHHQLGHRTEPVAGGGRFVRDYPQTVEETLAEARELLEDTEAPEWKKAPTRKLVENYETASQARRDAQSRIRELNTVYLKHRWSRAFLVQGGHVHSSMECSTCNRQGNATDFVWLPQYSGSDENLIVEDAGERACTVCYPSAPVDVLQRPTRIFSDDERRQIEEAEARRAQREANRSARAAKAPTASGEPLVLEVGENVNHRGETRMRKTELRTERTAITFATDIVAAQRSGNRWMAPYEVNTTHYDTVVGAITRAIAEKRDCEPSEVLEEITRKADAKIRKASR